MLSSCLIPNCRNISNKFRFVIPNNFQKRRTIYKSSCQCVTNVSTSDIYSTKKLSNTLDDADEFGILRESIERSKNKLLKTRTLKDFKIIKVKKKLRSSQPNEADVFGNLSSKNPIWYPDIKEDAQVDNDQGDDSTLVKNISKKYRLPSDYLQRMKDLVAEKKLKEALDLFIDMRRNFVAPGHNHFTFMIGACGRFGFTEMAFKLLKQMTDRNFKPTCATLTGLFNACAESPFPEFGLRKARLLKDKIETKYWPLNEITYHAMIKAFGKCGDIQTSFQIVDEMAAAKIKINTSTFNFLLVSCISNKEAGFTHSIEVLRKMKEKKCLPDIFSFNLLLRATRDCGAGPEEVSSLLLQHWSSYSKRPYGFKTKNAVAQKEMLQLPPGETSGFIDTLDEQNIPRENFSVHEKCDSKSNEDVSKNLLKIKLENSLITDMQKDIQPSVISARPLRGTEILEIGQLKTASDRFVLIGNSVGFLANMKEIRVKPNIKTFTLILECLPQNTESEEQLMSLLEKYKVTPDTGFFNILIKRRHYRFDTAAAHEVLILMNKWALSPDIITFGVLSLGCRSHKQYNIFMNDMEKLGITPNIEIIECLLTSACCHVDFLFIQSLLHLLEDLNIAPTEVMLKKIETTIENARKNIIDMEHGKSVPKIYKKKDIPKSYKKFCVMYEHWLKKTSFGKEDHVWNQFRTNIVEKRIEKIYTPLILD